HFAGKKYFYITADYTWGHTTEASLRQFTDTADTQAHPQVTVPFPRFHYRELKAAMDAAAASDTDVLVLVLFGDQMVKAMRLAYELGLTGRMQITVPNLTLSMVDQVGPAIMQGVIGATPWTWNVPFHFNLPRGQTFMQDFARHYDTYPSTSAASAYSIVFQWAEGVERAESFDSEALIRVLEGHRYTLLKDEQQWRAF